jgi:hypothetical protein
MQMAHYGQQWQWATRYLQSDGFRSPKGAANARDRASGPAVAARWPSNKHFSGIWEKCFARLSRLMASTMVNLTKRPNASMRTKAVMHIRAHARGRLVRHGRLSIVGILATGQQRRQHQSTVRGELVLENASLPPEIVVNCAVIFANGQLIMALDHSLSLSQE